MYMYIISIITRELHKTHHISYLICNVEHERYSSPSIGHNSDICSFYIQSDSNNTGRIDNYVISICHIKGKGCLTKNPETHKCRACRAMLRHM